MRERNGLSPGKDSSELVASSLLSIHLLLPSCHVLPTHKKRDDTWKRQIHTSYPRVHDILKSWIVDHDDICYCYQLDILFVT